MTLRCHSCQRIPVDGRGCMLRLLYGEAPGVIHSAVRQTFHNNVLFTTMYD